MKENNLELLCPAGNVDSFKAACQNGADAIYMGASKFNARVMAKNFTVDEYIDCIKYAHMRNIKVFLTLNTLTYDSEIKEALELVLELYKNGLDAVIVQDIGLAMLIRKLIPELPLHASTQMSVYSLEQVKFLESLGFKRVVLARELTIDEIEYICKNTSVEIEVFVHGALCVSFSGQCLFSSTIGNRSANRGNCAQSCRMRYSLCDSKDKVLVDKKYILSKKDIFGLELLRRLANAGVYSFKIEGRNKTPEYVAGVTSIYRKYVDKIMQDNEENNNINKDKYVLKQLFNRNGQSTGYLDGVKKQESITTISPKNMGLYLGKVISKKGHIIKIKLEEDIDLHDGIEVYSGDTTVASNIVTFIKDNTGKVVNSNVEKGNIVYIGDITGKISVGDNVYKTSSNKLNKSLRDTYENNVQKRKIDIDVKLEILKDKNVIIYYSFNGKENKIVLDYVPDIAIKNSINDEQIISNFTKTKDIPYNYNLVDIKLDDGLFIPVSKLNMIRNAIYEDIEKNISVNIDIASKEKELDNILKINNSNISYNNVNSNKQLYIYSYDKNIDYLKKYNTITDMYINVCDMYKHEDDIYTKYSKVNVNICISNVTGKNIDKYIEQNLERLISKFNIKSIVLGSYKYLNLVKDLKKKYNFKLVADYTLNITNSYSAMFIKDQGFDELIVTGEQLEDSILDVSKIIKTSILNGQICVMTSRYCIVGSFLKGKNENKLKNCTMPCMQDKYHIKDLHGYNYDLVCDNIDCLMKVIRYVKASTNKIDMIDSIL